MQLRLTYFLDLPLLLLHGTVHPFEEKTMRLLSYFYSITSLFLSQKSFITVQRENTCRSWTLNPSKHRMTEPKLHVLILTFTIGSFFAPRPPPPTRLTSISAYFKFKIWSFKSDLPISSSFLSFISYLLSFSVNLSNELSHLSTQNFSISRYIKLSLPLSWQTITKTMDRSAHPDAHIMTPSPSTVSITYTILCSASSLPLLHTYLLILFPPSPPPTCRIACDLAPAFL